MKKLFLTFSMLLLLTVSAGAQNRSIQFEETKVWQEIVDKAKAENKMIFVDCYTDWCGPCKMLAKEVFTKDEVADFYNKHFINAKFEMEKDAEGPALKDKWQVAAFPTMVFVDPKTGTVVHRLVGAGKPEWLIDGGKTALDPARNMNSLKERYDNGDRSPEFIATYLKALKNAYMQEEQTKIASEYINSMTLEQLATPEGWMLIRDNISDPLSKPMRTVVEHRKKFYDIPEVGQEYVDRVIFSSMVNHAAQMANSNPNPARGGFNQKRFDEMSEYYRSVDHPAAKIGLVWLDTSKLSRNGDWKAMLAKMDEVEKEQILQPDHVYYMYFGNFIESLAGMNDETAVRTGVRIVDEKIESIKGETTNDYFTKAALSDIKQRLLRSIGDEIGADKAKMDVEEYSKAGEAASGGKAQRAVRMN